MQPSAIERGAGEEKKLGRICVTSILGQFSSGLKSVCFLFFYETVGQVWPHEETEKSLCYSHRSEDKGPAHHTGPRGDIRALREGRRVAHRPQP